MTFVFYLFSVIYGLIKGKCLSLRIGISVTLQMNK